LPAVIKRSGQVGGVIGKEGDRSSGGQGPNDTVGGSVGGNAWDTAGRKRPSCAVGECGRRGRSRHILAVGEGEGFQGRTRHTPIDPIRCAITINGGSGIALPPNGRHGLNIRARIARTAEFTHTACIRIHHVNIPWLVRTNHEVWMGGSPPGRR
jgi:hypothetical protein